VNRPSQELVDAFIVWYRAYPNAQNEDRYAGQVTGEALRGLLREQFIEFFVQFARDGGKVQSGGHRTAPLFRKTIQAKYEAFRSFALEPFGEGFDEVKWLDRTKEFPGFGQGLATIYLNRVDKKRFAIVNNKAIEAVSLLGVQVPVALGARFAAIRDAERQLIEWFPEFDNFYRADALAQFLIGEKVGQPWAKQLRGNTQKGGRSWIFAPGERARLWEQYQTEGVMGIGWSPLDWDLGQLKTEEELRKTYNTAYGDRATDQDFHQVCDFLLKMRVGDRVFVKRGTGAIVGYGEVASDYFFDGSRPEYRHLRRAKWLKIGSWSIPEGERGLPVKTLTEIKDPERLNALLALIGQAPDGDALFGKKAFELLSELHEHPLQSFYEEHAEEFDATIEAPLKRLMSGVANALPANITDMLETQKGLFSRIPKNDYGRGGAWDFYWGAFYPKGGKRIADPQLFVFVSANVLRFGFYIGDYGTDPRKRFVKNCSEHSAILKKLLEPMLVGNDLEFGESGRVAPPSSTQSGRLTWSEWLSDPETVGIQAAIELEPDVVVTMSEAQVSAEVVTTFKRLFPLITLAQNDAPLESIRRYLGAGPPAEDNPVYPLDQVADDTHIGREELEQWVRAINRKRQAILYGPPGTGKTYLAQLLARHIIGGGDGFSDLLQFHPSYAYEDFMQGLRPKVLKGGGLEYWMVPGRFKDFCEKAAECKDACVLVIDEINRANLARVFGELMYLLEYRKESVPLAGGERFQIPSNVVIIGTMNTADRSIALVDHALRRRFAFLALYPNYDVLRKYHFESEFNPGGLIGVLERMNAAINDRHYSVGVSFFLEKEIRDKLQDVWQMEIEPYIEELFFDQQEKAKSFAWEKVRNEITGT